MWPQIKHFLFLTRALDILIDPSAKNFILRKMQKKFLNSI